MIVYPCIDSVYLCGHRLFPLIMGRRAASKVKAILWRVNPDIWTKVRNKLTVDSVSTCYCHIIISYWCSIVNLNIKISTSSTSLYNKGDTSTRNGYIIPYSEKGICKSLCKQVLIT